MGCLRKISGRCDVAVLKWLNHCQKVALTKQEQCQNLNTSLCGRNGNVCAKSAVTSFSVSHLFELHSIYRGKVCGSIHHDFQINMYLGAASNRVTTDVSFIHSYDGSSCPFHEQQSYCLRANCASNRLIDGEQPISVLYALSALGL